MPSDRFGPLTRCWDALNHSGLPCLDSWNVSLLLKYFGRGEQLAVCYKGREIVAMTFVRPGVIAHTFQPSNAPVGLWVSDPDYSPKNFLPGLAKATRSLLVGVMECDPDITSRPQDSDTLQTVEYISTARISVRGTFEEYWSSRSSNLRQNLKQRQKRLTREGLTGRMVVVSAPNDIGAAVDAYGYLESNGWKGATAVHPNNAQGAYYRELFEGLARRNAARVYQYFIGDKLVASDLCLVEKSLIILKTTYDESAGAFSPGLLLKHALFASVWHEVKRIEFYGRVHDRHLRWTDEVRSMYHINSYRWPWLKSLHVRARAGWRQPVPGPQPC